MVVVALLGLVLVVLWLVTWRKNTAKNLPPGPRGLPVVGSGLIVTVDDVRKHRDKYGDFFRVRVGSAELVFLCNYKLIKEAFTKMDFVDRPTWESAHFMTDGKEAGVIFANGQHWQNTRRFLLRNLRDLGMGKSRLDGVILHEARMLVDDFKTYHGRPTLFPQSLNIATLNVIWQLVASRRYSADQQEIHDFIALNKSLQEDTNFLFLPEFFPWLKRLPSFLTSRLTRAAMKAKAAGLTLFNEIIEAHEKDLDPANPRDLIDEYLLEMRGNNDVAQFFSGTDLIRCVFDLFAAGFDTTANTLRWMMLYMATYPQVQRRVQQQIDKVVARDTLVSHQHKSQLPYLDAVIHEVLRKSSMIPFGVFHYTTEHRELAGYTIPKGSCVVGASVFCHEDPALWPDPHKFNPDRFLDREGKFVAQKEGFLPFGLGRRQCLGESLARMEVFIFSAALLQNFTFSSPPTREVDLQPHTIPFISFCKNQELLITQR